jgi:hypothetical protein
MLCFLTTVCNTGNRCAYGTRNRYWVALIALTLGASCLGQAGGAWSFEEIEFDTVTGEGGEGGGGSLKEDASLAIDSAGRAHVSFVTEGELVQELLYVFDDGNDWVSSTIIGDAADPSLVLNSADQAHVSFTGGITGGLGHSFRGISGLWTVTEVDAAVSGVRPGAFSSMALDGFENPVISSQTILTGATPGAELRLATINPVGGIWSNVRVDPGTAGGGGSLDPTADTSWYTSLALDDVSGLARVSYYDAGTDDLRFATQTGASTWTLETVDSTDDVGHFTSLALDSSGNAHIGYYAATAGEVRHAEWNGVSWDIEAVVTGITASPDHLTLAIDGTDQAHITYLSKNGDGTSSVMYGLDAGSGWALETVVANSINSSLDLVADPSGDAHLVFENDLGELIYATNMPMPEPSTGILILVSALFLTRRGRRQE